MSDRPVAAFELGGRRSLDLTWTLRHRAVHPTELLASPGDLVRWLGLVGLPAPARASRFDLAEAVGLREAIARAAVASIDGTAIAADDRDVINRWAAEPPPSPALGADGSRRVVVGRGREVAAALSEIARDAIDVLTSSDGRLRRCAGPRCSLLFYDSSRPGSRRWCRTARCGNKVNTTAYRRRAIDRGSDPAPS